MRTFLAFELPEDFKHELSEIIEKFDKIDNSIKWVEKVNLHITLQFIGETKRKHISQIDQLIRSNLKEIKPFSLFSPKIELNNP